jgi:hypothetical protein
MHFVWWAFYMVALSGTLLVVYEICAAEHDIFLFSRGDTHFPNRVTYVFLEIPSSIGSWYLG